MSYEECREKRIKGLCFACDERYTPDHVCENKQFKFLIIEEELDVGVEPEWQDVVEDLGGGGFVNTLQLDYRSMAGQTTPRSFRLWGLVAGH